MRCVLWHVHEQTHPSTAQPANSIGHVVCSSASQALALAALAGLGFLAASASAAAKRSLPSARVHFTCAHTHPSAEHQPRQIYSASQRGSRVWPQASTSACTVRSALPQARSSSCMCSFGFSAKKLDRFFHTLAGTSTMLPPAASILARAEAENCVAWIVSGIASSPSPRICSPAAHLRQRPIVCLTDCMPGS